MEKILKRLQELQATRKAEMFSVNVYAYDKGAFITCYIDNGKNKEKFRFKANDTDNDIKMAHVEELLKNMKIIDHEEFLRPFHDKECEALASGDATMTLNAISKQNDEIGYVVSKGDDCAYTSYMVKKGMSEDELNAILSKL